MRQGTTALHMAALTGHSSIVELLLKHNADVEAKENVGPGSWGKERLFGRPWGKFWGPKRDAIGDSSGNQVPRNLAREDWTHVGQDGHLAQVPIGCAKALLSRHCVFRAHIFASACPTKADATPPSFVQRAAAMTPLWSCC